MNDDIQVISLEEYRKNNDIDPLFSNLDSEKLDMKSFMDGNITMTELGGNE